MGVAYVVPLTGKQVPKARYRVDVCSELLLFSRAIFTLTVIQHAPELNEGGPKMERLRLGGDSGGDIPTEHDEAPDGAEEDSILAL